MWCLVDPKSWQAEDSYEPATPALDARTCPRIPEPALVRGLFTRSVSVF